MSVHKRRYRDGRIVWRYRFDLPGSTRENRKSIEQSGFATRKEAQEAEAARRIAEHQKIEAAKARGGVAAPLPATLRAMLEEFFRYSQDKLAPKTHQRYRELASYLHEDLLAIPIMEITPLHLHREWDRLLQSGGHHRTTKAARPLAAKTVRNIAGLVSSAFARAIKWGLVDHNPVINSEPPLVKKHQAVALTIDQQRMLIDAATSPWCLAAILEVAAATGARRGEILALRWSDIRGNVVLISRSLTQTRAAALAFKDTKTGRSRSVVLPDSIIRVLEAHRMRQDEFRRQFGPDYRSDLDLVFANPDGTPLKPDSVSAAVSALFRRLQIPKPKGCALHLLRHSHTSVLLATGVPLPAVAARLGHSSIRTTQEIYAHMITGQDEEAARKWDLYQRQHSTTVEKEKVQ
jgi:integrase